MTKRQQSRTLFDQIYSKTDSQGIKIVVGIVYGVLQVRPVLTGVNFDVAISMLSQRPCP